MTSSQKNAISYSVRRRRGVLEDAVMQCCDLYPFFVNSKYAYVSNFLKYKCGITIHKSHIFCTSFMMYFWLKSYLDLYFKKEFVVVYKGV